MTAPFLLRGVDLAAFAVALVNRLHTGGVVVLQAAQRDSSRRYNMIGREPGYNSIGRRG